MQGHMHGVFIVFITCPYTAQANRAQVTCQQESGNGFYPSESPLPLSSQSPPL